MESSKRCRFAPKAKPKAIKTANDEDLIYCCYCSESYPISKSNKKSFYNGFNSRLHFFLISLGIPEDKLLCCKSCYMEVEKNKLEKYWLEKNMSLEYKGYFEENTHKFSDLNIIGDYCIIFDNNPNNREPYIIISISDNHKTFAINRFSKKYSI